MRKRKKYTIRIFLTLAMLIAYCLPLTATIRYVSKTGSSIPPYTSWATAADSIQKCINISVFGDTIYVANGVYKERVDMIPGLTLIGAGMDSCVIDSRNFNPNYTVRVTDSCYFSGFQIISYNITQGIGVVIYDVNIENIDAIVEKNKIIEAKDGMLITSSSLGFDNGYKLIKMNLITRVEKGIRCEQTAPIIEENFIFSKWYGIGAAIISLPTYKNNTVILNDPQAVSGYSGGFHIQSILKSNSFYIYLGEKGIYELGDSVINNVITGNPEYGMWTQDGGVVINNIIKGAQTGIDHDASTPLPQFKYNNLWDNEVNYKDINPDSTNISFNPMFVDEDSMDLHLQKYSPLIDAGDPTILDKDSTRSDIGLYGGPFGESYTYLDLAPRPPVNLTAEVDSNLITISWNNNTEADFSHYSLFRDTTSNFTADSTTFVTDLTDSFYAHIIQGGIEAYSYKITATDNQGNVSELSEELAVLITSVNEYPAIVSNYQLY